MHCSVHAACARVDGWVYAVRAPVCERAGVRACRCGALLVCGSADDVVDPEATQDLYDALEVEDKRHLVLEGGINNVSLIKAIEKISEVSYFFQPNLSQINLDLIINF